MNTHGEERIDRQQANSGVDTRRRKRGLIVHAGVIVLVLAGVGCAGFRGGELDETRVWPPPQSQGPKKPTLSLSLVGKGVIKGKPVPVPPAMADRWCRGTQETYASSGLFSELLPPGKQADLRAEVEVTDTGSGSMFLAYVCGLTLTVFPCRGKDEFTWKTTFKDSSGAVRGVVEKKESSIMWIQFFLIFVLPFDSPASMAQEVMRDLNRSTILDAMERGFLNP